MSKECFLRSFTVIIHHSHSWCLSGEIAERNYYVHIVLHTLCIPSDGERFCFNFQTPLHLCVYTFLCVRVTLCLCLCACVCAGIYIQCETNECVYVCIHVCIHVCMFATFACVFVCVCLNLCVYMQVICAFSCDPVETMYPC